MKTYTPAPAEVSDRVARLIERYYPELQRVNAKIDLLFVSSDTPGSALKLHGYPCLAVVRVVGLKERSKGHGDAEIVIEGDKYESLSPERRDALLDHELYHLVVVRDKKTTFYKVDSHGRPKLRTRLHDRQLGWFDEIARRHGEHSCEVHCATELYQEAGQIYFAFAAAVTSSTKPALKRGLEGMKKIAREHGAVISIHAAGADKKVVIDQSGVRSEPLAAAK